MQAKCKPGWLGCGNLRPSLKHIPCLREAGRGAKPECDLLGPERGLNSLGFGATD